MPNTDTPDLQSATTWATRNPSKDVQPTRIREKKVLTAAEKVTRDAHRKVPQSNNDAFYNDVAVFQEDRNAKIKDLAEKHCKTVDYVRLVLTNGTHYKHCRAPSLQNALVHHKSEQLNAGVCFQRCPSAI